MQLAMGGDLAAAKEEVSKLYNKDVKKFQKISTKEIMKIDRVAGRVNVVVVGGGPAGA
jgi:hypothetical protein